MDQDLEEATNQRRKPPKIRLRCTETGELDVDPSGCYQRVLDATENTALATGLVMQIATLGSRYKAVDQEATDFSLGFVDAMKPQDPAEALLCAQMAATHQAVMMMARKLNFIDTIQQQDSAERALNKLMRTYTTQMETLKRYRSKGQQLVRVERVTVEEGGQAIVGNVQHGGGGDEKT